MGRGVPVVKLSRERKPPDNAAAQMVAAAFAPFLRQMVTVTLARRPPPGSRTARLLLDILGEGFSRLAADIRNIR